MRLLSRSELRLRVGFHQLNYHSKKSPSLTINQRSFNINYCIELFIKTQFSIKWEKLPPLFVPLSER